MNKNQQLMAMITLAGLNMAEISRRSGVSSRTLQYWAMFEKVPTEGPFAVVWQTVISIIAERRAFAMGLPEVIYNATGVNLDGMAVPRRVNDMPHLAMVVDSAELKLAKLIKLESASGDNVLVLRPSSVSVLIEQTSNALGSLGVYHDVLGRTVKRESIIDNHLGMFNETFLSGASNVVLASLTAIHRKMGLLIEFNPKLIIILEGPISTGVLVQKIIDAVPGARISYYQGDRLEASNEIK